LGKALVDEFPEVEKAVRFISWGSRSIEYDGKFFDQDFLLYADPSIFDLFGVKLISGDTSTALREPNSIVVSEKVAKKIFGSVDEALGKIVILSGKDSYTVTAVMENQPEQSSVRMEVLVPFSVLENKYEWLRGWSSNSLDTYVRLRDGTDLSDLEAKFPEFLKSRTDDQEEHWRWELYLQPVKDVHLKSGHIKFQVMNYNQGDINMVYVFSIIAGLIILLACINFINLAIAQSVKRSREVGMRKVMGANKWSLMYQFLGESLIITLVSIILAVFVVLLLLPMFNNLLNHEFVVDFINNRLFNLGLLLILIIVSVVAGSYPAFYLSRFNPISVLKSSAISEGSRSGWLTKTLVIFQFVISIGMIFSLAVIYEQFNYTLNKDIGIDYNNVLSVRLYDKNTTENVEFLKNEFSKNPNVLGVSFVSDVNGVAGSQSSIQVDDTSETTITMRFGFVDYNFFNMMGIPIIAGRNFSREYALDEKESVILNRAAVEYLGWENPIGKAFMPFLDSTTKMKVIGVIEDYHYYSLYSKIEPAIYMINPERNNVLAVKIGSENQKETIAYLEKIWDSHFPGIPFSYQMAKDRLAKEYKGEESTFKIFTFFTLLSLVISCLGLYGLTSLMIERKNREIGIRKVFGGSVSQIVILLVNYFLRLILIAGLIAMPLSWYLMTKALDTFAYHITITWVYFAVSIIVAVIVALMTIIFHAIRAASADPIKTLRYE
jgi:putative ABC transport system permease protein